MLLLWLPPLLLSLRNVLPLSLSVMLGLLIWDAMTFLLDTKPTADIYTVTGSRLHPFCSFIQSGSTHLRCTRCVFWYQKYCCCYFHWEVCSVPFGSFPNFGSAHLRRGNLILSVNTAAYVITTVVGNWPPPLRLFPSSWVDSLGVDAPIFFRTSI